MRRNDQPIRAQSSPVNLDSSRRLRPTEQRWKPKRKHSANEVWNHSRPSTVDSNPVAKLLESAGDDTTSGITMCTRLRSAYPAARLAIDPRVFLI